MGLFRRRTNDNRAATPTREQPYDDTAAPTARQQGYDDAAAPTARQQGYDDAAAPTARQQAPAPTQQRAYETSDRNDGYAPTRQAYGSTQEAYPPPSGRTWHHGPIRAVMTLVAAAVAGLLAWLTTTFGHGTTGGYWAMYAILGGAGLVMALSQLLGGWTKWGRPRFSPTVFLLAFVPTAIAVGWILVFHQPHSTLWRGHVTNWSGNLGITGLVKDMGGPLLTMLSFGLGLVFGFCFDTTGVQRPGVTQTRARTAPRAEADEAANEPLARQRALERESQGQAQANRNGETVRS